MLRAAPAVRAPPHPIPSMTTPRACMTLQRRCCCMLLGALPPATACGIVRGRLRPRGPARRRRPLLLMMMAVMGWVWARHRHRQHSGACSMRPWLLNRGCPAAPYPHQPQPQATTVTAGGAARGMPAWPLCVTRCTRLLASLRLRLLLQPWQVVRVLGHRSRPTVRLLRRHSSRARTRYLQLCSP